MKDTVTIEITVRTDKVGSKCNTVVEYDREDWEEMDGAERNQSLLDDLLVSGLIEWGYEVQD